MQDAGGRHLPDSQKGDPGHRYHCVRRFGCSQGLRCDCGRGARSRGAAHRGHYRPAAGGVAETSVARRAGATETHCPRGRTLWLRSCAPVDSTRSSVRGCGARQDDAAGRRLIEHQRRLNCLRSALGRAVNTPSAWSSSFGATARSPTATWPRTRRGCSRCSHSPHGIWSGALSCHRGRGVCVERRRPPNAAKLSASPLSSVLQGSRTRPAVM